MNYLTIKELSEKYGINKNYIHKAVLKGQIPFLKRAVKIKKQKGGNTNSEIIVIDEFDFKIFMLCREFSNKNSQEIYNFCRILKEKAQK